MDVRDIGRRGLLEPRRHGIGVFVQCGTIQINASAHCVGPQGVHPHDSVDRARAQEIEPTIILRKRPRL